MLAYNNHSWETAIKSMSDYLNEHKNDYEILFYYGLSLTMGGEVDEGIRVLERVKDHINDPDYEAAANWYLALVLLKSDQTKEATKILRTIATSKHYKSGKAIEILEKLN